MTSRKRKNEDEHHERRRTESMVAAYALMQLTRASKVQHEDERISDTSAASERQRIEYVDRATQTGMKYEVSEIQNPHVPYERLPEGPIQLKKWERTLLAVAEGKTMLPENAEELNDANDPEEELRAVGRYSYFSAINKIQSGSTTNPRSSRSKKESLHYLPTEKYWLTRIGRAYYSLRGRVKEIPVADSIKSVVATHQTIVAAFNLCFEGKYMDGCAQPRPARPFSGVHQWIIRLGKPGNELGEGDIPDFWAQYGKSIKPAHISLDEDPPKDWDDDDYLCIKSER